jgi:hypothetical protein
MFCLFGGDGECEKKQSISLIFSVLFIYFIFFHHLSPSPSARNSGEPLVRRADHDFFSALIISISRVGDHSA